MSTKRNFWWVCLKVTVSPHCCPTCGKLFYLCCVRACVHDRMCVHCCSLRSPVRKEPPSQWAAITYGEHKTRCKRRNLIFSYELGASTDINDGLFLSTETATESRKGQGTGAEVCEWSDCSLWLLNIEYPAVEIIKSFPQHCLVLCISVYCLLCAHKVFENFANLLTSAA